jgi:hypothetical protein
MPEFSLILSHFDAGPDRNVPEITAQAGCRVGRQVRGEVIKRGFPPHPSHYSPPKDTEHGSFGALALAFGSDAAVIMKAMRCDYPMKAKRCDYPTRDTLLSSEVGA